MVPGTATKRHLKEQHQDWTLKLRRDIVQHVSQLSLAQPGDVCFLTPGEPAIPGLTLYDGWRCLKCQYCSSSNGTMMEHCKHAHQWANAAGIAWKPANVQSFFTGPRRCFFEVTIARGRSKKATIISRPRSKAY